MAPSFSSDDDSDAHLEVLPPSAKSGASNGDNYDDGKPRLSFTGNSKKDPVSLLDDEDDGAEVQLPPQRPAVIKTEKSLDSKQNVEKKVAASRVVMAKKPRPKESSRTAKRAVTSTFSSSSSDDDSLIKIPQAPKTAVPRKVMAGFSSSSDDDDDDSLEDVRQRLKAASAQRTTKTTQQRKGAPKKRARPTTDTAATKQAERAAQRQAREQQRLAKQAQQKATQQARERQKQACQQAAGKLAHTEIAVLWDIPHPQWDASNDDNDDCTPFHIVEHSFDGRANTVQWIRLDALQGGAEQAIAAWEGGASSTTGGYEHIPVVAIVASAETFLDLLQHDGDDDYPRLEVWITSFQEQWKTTWKTDKEPRIILLMDQVQEDLEKRWKRSKSKHDLATIEELHDAITWLLIQFRVECIRCKSEDELLNHLKKITRLLAEAPYVQETTEIACVKKLPSELDTDKCTEEERAHDVWLRQIQQVPNVSNQKALAFVQYYPTSVSLWRDYMDPNVEEPSKRLLVADMFIEKRQFRKLANQVYTLMTTQDPNEVI